MIFCRRCCHEDSRGVRRSTSALAAACRLISPSLEGRVVVVSRGKVSVCRRKGARFISSMTCRMSSWKMASASDREGGRAPVIPPPTEGTAVEERPPEEEVTEAVGDLSLLRRRRRSELFPTAHAEMDSQEGLLVGLLLLLLLLLMVLLLRT